ncbi:hypothetical protein [Alphaentomopoxvirus acuprea]|uniref:Uncharacterized protein n=1 Tax=Alphaentomopoxvirus acuprea TaxID=62099 RepID=W6JLL6_9POXV|nr:hypothetical protein BA82_gp171 [Anomala cuprea entomopoxvirus]BAO49531.1 hypothetical protein [Anomala cuprea entomopoxvirus]
MYLTMKDLNSILYLNNDIIDETHYDTINISILDILPEFIDLIKNSVDNNL